MANLATVSGTILAQGIQFGLVTGKIVEQIGKLRSAKFSFPEYSQYTCPSTKNISLKEKAVTVFAKWNHAIRIIQSMRAN